MKTHVVAFLFLACLCAKAEAPSAAWYTYYYMDPQPDKFTTEVRNMSQKGDLTKVDAQQPLIAFFSRVMAQNPDKISPWMKELENLPPNDKRVLYSAIWFSNTPQGKEFFITNKLPGYLKKEPPDILKTQPDSPSSLDMLWGYFMATGDPKAIRGIVSALSLSKDEGALARFKNTQKTDEDKKAAYLDAAFQAARNSLTSNCLQHPKVMEICETLYKSNELNKAESAELNNILAKVAPDRYTAKPTGIKPPAPEAAPKAATTPKPPVSPPKGGPKPLLY
ncbi:MAG: hypothetical protein ABI615_13025 [Chthoniobacterales bacterium]